jgi:UTP--glucose-1-phosphate uridylyltransferase
VAGRGTRLGEHADLLTRHLGDRVEYVRQPEPLGLGDAVVRGAEAVGDQPYVVALGDALIEPPSIVSRLIDAFDGHDAAIAVEDVGPDRTASYGIVDCDYSTTGAPVRGIVEKPAPGTAPSTLAVAGRYVLGPGLRAAAPGVGGEIQLTDALRGLNAVAVGLRRDERRLDVGDPEGYAQAFLARYESRRR